MADEESQLEELEVLSSIFPDELEVVQAEEAWRGGRGGSGGGME